MHDFHQISNKKILWSCLNWGQGHVYRSIPLIQRLQEVGNTFHIACSSKQRKVIEHYLQAITYHQLNEYPFKFVANKSIAASNFFQLPQLLTQHSQDFRTCEKIVKEEAIDYVVSDHRYGFCSKKVPSIFLTHQCQLPTKNRFLQKQHHRFINQNFQQVWILDDEQHQFAGQLSETTSIRIPVEFIGIASRFENRVEDTKDLTVAIISGPEPYNQLLLDEVKQSAIKNNERIHVITNLDFDHELLLPVAFENQDEVILKAKQIISYCGYTTLMDLAFLQPVETFLKPTPKQAEQIHLATLYRDRFNLQ